MSALRPCAIQYTCRNPGQTALLWAWQPTPFGHGWIDVKAEPLVRLSEVEAEYVSLLPGVYYMDPPDGGAPTLLEQMQRMAQDAARYRWLRANQLDGLEIMEKFVGEQMEYVTDEELDAAIDQELRK